MKKKEVFRKHKKLHIKVGDTVRVIAGNSKNSEGKVLSIDKRKLRAKVEGLQMITKHIKPSQDQEGRREQVEGTIHISNLQHITSNGELSRMARKLNEEGVRVRYLKKTGEILQQILR